MGENDRARRVDLRVKDLELLVRACRKYKASLPVYLASAQEDVERAQELIEKFEAIVAKESG